MIICIPFHCFCQQRALVDSIKEEILSLKHNCKCPSSEEGRKLKDLDDQPALKKGSPPKNMKRVSSCIGLMVLMFPFTYRVLYLSDFLLYSLQGVLRSSVSFWQTSCRNSRWNVVKKT